MIRKYIYRYSALNYIQTFVFTKHKKLTVIMIMLDNRHRDGCIYYGGVNYGRITGHRILTFPAHTISDISH